MIKNKIIALMTCGALISAGIAGGALISNKSSNTNEKTIQNHVLLATPDLNNLAVVINTNVNPLVLYNSPNSNSNIESYISVGEMLNYTATNNPNFYKVTVQETGATGYISASNMQIIQSGLNKAYENVNKNGQVINVTYDVKLMSSPNVHSQILGSYKNNAKMTVLGKQDQWYKIKIGNQTGYMYQSYVGIDNSSNTTINNNSSNTTTNNNSSSINPNYVLTQAGYNKLYNNLEKKIDSTIQYKNKDKVTTDYLSKYFSPVAAVNMSYVPVIDLNNGTYKFESIISSQMPNPTNPNKMPFSIPLNIYNSAAKGYLIITISK